jgi:hypothetical protein
MILIVSLVMGLFLASSGFLASSTSLSGTRKPLVIIVVNSTIYKPIEMSLDQYMKDVENDGFAVQAVQTNQLWEKTASGIRSYLREAFPRRLVGAFLVGDLPEVWYEIGNAPLPTDMYYRDLDGEWIDLDDDGVYESHIGNTAPEIWIGRLRASLISGNETSLINNYFVKNHRYRNGLRALPWWRALAYVDDDGVEWAQDINSSLSLVNSDVTLVTDPATTTAQDYLKRIADPFGFQWIYLMCHGYSNYHMFMVNGESKGGTVYPYQYRDIDPRAFFYMLFVCSGARYTEADYLAGTVVFTQNFGLVSIGATDIIYSVSFRKFFGELNESKTIGTAFHDWFIEQDKWQGQLREGEDYRYVFYGLTIIGDPTLKLDIRPSMLRDVSVSDAGITVLNVSNTYSLVVTVNVKNLGDFDESLEVSVYKQRDRLAYSQVSVPAKSYRILNLTIDPSYRVLVSNFSKTEFILSSTAVSEEYNLGDNTNYLTLDNILVLPPEPFQLNPWAAPIVIISIALVIAYGTLRVIAADYTLPTFVLKGKRILEERLPMWMRRNRKDEEIS